MVRCTNCGSENSDDSKFCAKCGGSLNPPLGAAARTDDTWERRRREREACFGIPGSFWPLLIGVAIVLWGLAEITQMYYHVSIPWWPVVVILVGLLIIFSAYRRRT